MYSIYSLGPAPWGTDYRFVEAFDTEEDAKEVLAVLEKVNILFNCYEIIEQDYIQINKQLRAENKKMKDFIEKTNNKEAYIQWCNCNKSLKR